ncbi:MAG: glutaredoxin family protein [Ostreibacterium sp.]
MTLKDNKTIIFYHTLGCHLCDETLALVAQIIHVEKLDITLEQIDIIHNNTLLSHYGEIIPALKRFDDKVLSYPFTRQTLAQWLKSA